MQIGAGAYGIVVSAEDTTNGKKTAIKKVQNAFQYVRNSGRCSRTRTHVQTTACGCMLTADCMRGCAPPAASQRGRCPPVC
ncbi:hypothetical protein EON67_03525 [archaeon]|nr:MAG: hypothetical protein EON67_03525 [archaeon]